MLLNGCCYIFVFHTFVKANNKNATVVVAMGSPTRSNNALKQAASPSFHCRHSNVKLQHCSICFPLVFSRSWMNPRCSTVNPSQAKTWLTTVRILPPFWEGIEVLLSNLSAVILRIYHEKESQERGCHPAADLKVHCLREEGHSVKQCRHEGEIQNGRKD